MPSTSPAALSIPDLRAAIDGRVIALIDGGSRTATVTAIEPIAALVIDRAGFQRLMDDHPVVRHDLVSALTQRLRQRAPTPLD